MLKLKNICKNYAVAGLEVKALKNVNLAFRKSEFVSILGPSGCGKTTMLNIIGGLDRYTSGDLIIEGRSTKEFKDKDWDAYRNHSIGFVFQSYNLIPHQTILQNVELALQIGGLSHSERENKAKKALDKVGLSGLYNKKPNQLSGGQCQRVAIARAIVNNPEILLADEPTGALDTATSVQIMDLIKEIAKERLVIMVTHNPELANRYSTRIINLLDGEVTNDSNPYKGEDDTYTNETKLDKIEVITNTSQNIKETSTANLVETTNISDINADIKSTSKLNITTDDKGNISKTDKEKSSKKITKKSTKSKKKRVKMSFWTAFKLSFKNLVSKKGRTIMMSIAGSIGIVGISLVLSISYGVKNYIANMQNDMLSGNPVTISQQTYDYEAMMSSVSGKDKLDAVAKAGIVNIDKMFEHIIGRADSMSNMFIENEITETYRKFIEEMPKEYYSAILYDFDLDVANNIYVDYKVDSADTNTNKTSLTGLRAIYGSLLEKSGNSKYSTYLTGKKNFKQAPTDEKYILSQYDLKSGKIASAEDEVMIVLEEDSIISDMILANLGYYTQEEYLNIIYKATNNDKYNASLDKNQISYEQLMNKSFVYYPNNSIYTATGNNMKPFTYKPTNEGLTGGVQLKVVGILEPKQNISYGCMRSGFYYTEAFTKDYIQTNYDSEIVKFVKDAGLNAINSIKNPITFDYNYQYEGTDYTSKGYVGKQKTFARNSGEPIVVYEITLNNLGGNLLPFDIIVFNSSFNQKELALGYLDKWNSNQTLIIDGEKVLADDRQDIKYTDNLSLMIEMINTFIDIVTYSLLGFTALSLVVSSVMIGIITYISVVERIKEIGVIRSLGGRKRDVSNLFISETFIIGASSGIVGIIITYIVSAIINAVVSNLLPTVLKIAIFPWQYALIMLAVSVLLTLISGLIPARSAAKKAPVTALRSE